MYVKLIGMKSKQRILYNSPFTGMTISQGRFNGLIFIRSMNIIYFLSIARPKLAQFRIDQEIHFSSSPFAFDEVLE